MNTQNKHDSSDDCDKCSNGYYRTQQHDSASCVYCNAGKYLSGNVASDHASESNCKICQYSRYSYQDMGLAAGVMRENSSMIMQQQEVNMIIRMIVGYALRENTEKQNVQNTCKSCPAGTYNSYGTANAIHHDAHTDCKVCLSWKIHELYSSPSCIMCPPGATRGSISDGLSWTGTNHLLADSVDDCVVVPFRTICSGNKYNCTSSCAPCEVGKYQNEVGQLSCKSCLICNAGEFIIFWMKINIPSFNI